MSIPLHIAGPLRIELDEDDLSMATVRHDELGVVLVLQIFPTWRTSAPVQAAELALIALRPTAPAYTRDTEIAPPGSAGYYRSKPDEVAVVNRSAKSDQRIAQIVLHEVAHATGAPTRLARFAASDSDDMSLVGSGDPVVDLAEEIVANLASHLVSVRLGIAGDYQTWLEQMARLPAERLPGVISDSKRAATFILNIAP